MKSRRLTDALSRDLRSSGLVSRFLAMSPSLRLPQHARNLVTCLPGTLPPWHKGGKRYPVMGIRWGQTRLMVFNVGEGYVTPSTLQKFRPKDGNTLISSRSLSLVSGYTSSRET